MEVRKRGAHLLELICGRQERRTKVERVRIRLPKTGSRDDNEPGGLEEFERVKLVGHDARLACLCDRIDRQLDPREEVQRALGGRARDAVERVERECECVGAAAERVEDACTLGAVVLVARLALPGKGGGAGGGSGGGSAGGAGGGQGVLRGGGEDEGWGGVLEGG